MIGPFGLRPKGTMAARALPLARALAAVDHQVQLVLPPWSCPEDSGKSWEVDGVMVNNVALPTSPPGVFHAQLTQRLVQSALAMEPDVIHCFKPKAYSGLAQSAL